MRKLAFMLALLLVLLPSCGQPKPTHEAETLAITTTTMEETETITEVVTTTSTADYPIAIDLSDEAHAIESLRAFYFANKDLLNSLRDDLWAMNQYRYFDFHLSQGEISIQACILNPGKDEYEYPHISLNQIDALLLHHVKQFYDVAKSDSYRSFGLGYYWDSRAVMFDFGFLKSNGNKCARIIYSPFYQPPIYPYSQTHFAEKLENYWYICISWVDF